MTDKLQTADWIAIASGTAAIVVSLAALVVAIYAVYRGNRNTSAATMVTLNVAFRDAWERFLNSGSEQKEFHFGELMNLFEIACGVYQEKSLVGVSGKLVRDYMEDILGELVKSAYADERIPKLLTGPTTFVHIKKFLNDKPQHPSVTVPIKWYQSCSR